MTRRVKTPISGFYVSSCGFHIVEIVKLSHFRVRYKESKAGKDRAKYRPKIFGFYLNEPCTSLYGNFQRYPEYGGIFKQFILNDWEYLYDS